ncbi:unnamed protein product [Cuscuta campestris]|uniref:DUF4283 domain-containing protein n=1 Tax=Cuscuta campestris TaxID=132261 RepID=A0A484MLL0_9ASTE|nr:unnamed protein product [Cuscuta campestris]
MAGHRPPDPPLQPPDVSAVSLIPNTTITAAGNLQIAATQVAAATPFFPVTTGHGGPSHTSQVLPHTQAIPTHPFAVTSATGIGLSHATSASGLHAGSSPVMVSQSICSVVDHSHSVPHVMTHPQRPSMAALSSDINPPFLGSSSTAAMAAQVTPLSSSFVALVPHDLGAHVSFPTSAIPPLDVGFNANASTALLSSCPPTVRPIASMGSSLVKTDFMQVKIPVHAFTQFNMNNVPGLELKGTVDDSHVLVHVPFSSFALFQRQEVPGAVPIALTRSNGYVYGEEQPSVADFQVPHTSSGYTGHYPFLFKPLNLELPHERKARLAQSLVGTSLDGAAQSLSNVHSGEIGTDTSHAHVGKAAQQAVQVGTSPINEVSVQVPKENPSILGPGPLHEGMTVAPAPTSTPNIMHGASSHVRPGGEKGVTFAPHNASTMERQSAPTPKMAAIISKNVTAVTAPWQGGPQGMPKPSFAQAVAGPSTPGPSKSFAQAVSGSSNPGISLRAIASRPSAILPNVVVEDKTPTFHRGTPGVVFKRSEMQKLSQLDNFLLIGKFSHGRPEIATLRKFFAEKFLLRESVQISLRDPRHVMILFTHPLDCNDIFMQGQIQFNGQFPMRLFRWSPEFNVKTESSVAPVWVTFPNLRADLFNESAIHQLCKPIRRCLKVDVATSTFSRPNVAKARVEIYLLKPRIEQIWIGFSDEPGEEDVGMFHSVEYERIPKYCTACYKQGHDNSSCNTLTPTQPDQRAVVVVPQPSTTAPTNTQPPRRRRSRSRVRRQREGKGIAILDAGTSAGGSQREESQYVWREKTAKGSRPIEVVDTDEVGKGEGPSLQAFVPTSSHPSPNVVIPDACLVPSTVVNATPPTSVVVEQSASQALEPSVPPTGVEQGPVVASLPLSTSSSSFIVHVPDPQPPELALAMSNTFDALGVMPGTVMRSATLILLHPPFLPIRDREPLWEYLRETHAALPADMAWGVVGDFNCLLDPSEKKGGRPYAPVKYQPFVECVEDCELVDSPFIGEDYTWFNNRVGGVEVRSRIDRLLFNQPWMDMFSCLVHHLDRVGSDHAPLLVECKSHERPPARPFTFLNVWTEHEDFQRVVADSWREDITGSPMFVFGAKLKRLEHSLKRWNRDTFGHIFDRLKVLEQDVWDIELQLQTDSSDETYI